MLVGKETQEVFVQENKAMTSARLPMVVAQLAGLLALIMAAPGWGENLAPVRLTPDEIRLTVDASRPGSMDTATLAGDMGKAGLYAARVRIPAGLKVLPHLHPDDRLVVVLSGTLHVGFGERFEPERMKALPPGGFFTEPAGQPHFAWARAGDVILQVSGMGPSGTIYVQPGKAED
jgi:quercetin dioxygenase-like cupin family protein